MAASGAGGAERRGGDRGGKGFGFEGGREAFSAFRKPEDGGNELVGLVLGGLFREEIDGGGHGGVRIAASPGGEGLDSHASVRMSSGDVGQEFERGGSWVGGEAGQGARPHRRWDGGVGEHRGKAFGGVLELRAADQFGDLNTDRLGGVVEKWQKIFQIRGNNVARASGVEQRREGGGPTGVVGDTLFIGEQGELFRVGETTDDLGDRGGVLRREGAGGPQLKGGWHDFWTGGGVKGVDELADGAEVIGLIGQLGKPLGLGFAGGEGQREVEVAVHGVVESSERSLGGVGAVPEAEAVNRFQADLGMFVVDGAAETFGDVAEGFRAVNQDTDGGGSGVMIGGGQDGFEQVVVEDSEGL